MRDADATRAKLLEAAGAEFATRGIAGARVDRIAADAGCNKSLIYAYFGSKEGLFDAVFDALVVDTVQDVPIDVDDLPGYAGRFFDWAVEHPRSVRLAIFHILERGPRDDASAASVTATRAKVEAIAAAQRAGTLSVAHPADGVDQPDPGDDTDGGVAVRARRDARTWPPRAGGSGRPSSRRCG